MKLDSCFRHAVLLLLHMESACCRNVSAVLFQLYFDCPDTITHSDDSHNVCNIIRITKNSEWLSYFWQACVELFRLVSARRLIAEFPATCSNLNTTKHLMQRCISFDRVIKPYTGWPKKVRHYQMIKKIALNRVKACKWNKIYWSD